MAGPPTKAVGSPGSGRQVGARLELRPGRLAPDGRCGSSVHAMSDAPVDDDSPIEVHAVLVCRGVEGTKGGGVDVRDVIDVLVVPKFPAQAGPLTFCAFVRANRAGEADVSFRVYPLHHPETTVMTLPGRLRVQKGYEGRQSVIGSGFKTITFHAGGWYGIEFRVGETVLAKTRFAVGARSSGEAAPGGAASGPAAPPPAS